MMPTKTSAAPNEVVCLEAMWLPPPLYAKTRSRSTEIGFGGAADAAEMRNRFAFAILTFS